MEEGDDEGEGEEGAEEERSVDEERVGLDSDGVKVEGLDMLGDAMWKDMVSMSTRVQDRCVEVYVVSTVLG